MHLPSDNKTKLAAVGRAVAAHWVLPESVLCYMTSRENAGNFQREMKWKNTLSPSVSALWRLLWRGTCGFSWPRSKRDYEEVERTAEPASEGLTSLRVRGVTSGHKVLTKHCWRIKLVGNEWMGCIGEYHCDFSKGTEYFTSGLDFSVRKKKKSLSIRWWARLKKKKKEVHWIHRKLFKKLSHGRHSHGLTACWEGRKDGSVQLLIFFCFSDVNLSLAMAGVKLCTEWMDLRPNRISQLDLFATSEILCCLIFTKMWYL